MISCGPQPGMRCGLWGLLVLVQALWVLPACVSWGCVCEHQGSWSSWWTLQFQESFRLLVEDLVKAWCYCLVCLERFLLLHCFQFPLNFCWWTQADRTQEYQHWQKNSTVCRAKKRNSKAALSEPSSWVSFVAKGAGRRLWHGKGHRRTA